MCQVALSIFPGHAFTGQMGLALAPVCINPCKVNVKAILIMKVQFLLPQHVLKSASSGPCPALKSRNQGSPVDSLISGDNTTKFPRSSAFLCIVGSYYYNSA